MSEAKKCAICGKELEELTAELFDDAGNSSGDICMECFDKEIDPEEFHELRNCYS